MAKRFKDWKPDECRIKADLITPQGAHMEWYMPHLTREEGLAFACLCNNIITSSPEDKSEVVEAILKLNDKLQEENKKLKEAQCQTDKKI